MMQQQLRAQLVYAAKSLLAHRKESYIPIYPRTMYLVYLYSSNDKDADVREKASGEL